MTYDEFLASKAKTFVGDGMKVKRSDLSPFLYDFQKDVIEWALNKGRSCIFGGTGTGKTAMQTEFAKQHDGVRLIVAPLGVTEQTIHEGEIHNGVTIKRANTEKDIKCSGIYITNYERLEKIECPVDVIVIDESSILKGFDSHYRKYIQDRFDGTRYKLACTATPAPNDYMELGTHSEFVGALTRQEMLATYFCHDGADTSKWRLKRHAVGDFWRWVSNWAAVFNHPRDLGYEMDGYDLPPLQFFTHTVDVEPLTGGSLFGDDVSATNLYKVLKNSGQERAEVVRQLVDNEPNESWLIWCHTDEEQRMIEKLIPQAVSVYGSLDVDKKVDRLAGFAEGRYKILVTKLKIAGQGMNFQVCARQVNCGVTYSFEQIYQGVRRSWRYGQKRPVDVHMVICNELESVKASVDLKQMAFDDMAKEIKKYCGGVLR